jgi:hypothetical protein
MITGYASSATAAAVQAKPDGTARRAIARRAVVCSPGSLSIGQLPQRTPLRAYQLCWATFLPEPAVTKSKGRVAPAAMVLS